MYILVLLFSFFISSVGYTYPRKGHKGGGSFTSYKGLSKTLRKERFKRLRLQLIARKPDYSKETYDNKAKKLECPKKSPVSNLSSVDKKVEEPGFDSMKNRFPSFYMEWIQNYMWWQACVSQRQMFEWVQAHEVLRRESLRGEALELERKRIEWRNCSLEENRRKRVESGKDSHP